MPVRTLVRRGAYHDSVALMQAQRELRALPGVEEAGVVMGTEANRGLLHEAGLGSPDLDAAGPDDLVVAVRGADDAALDAALGRAGEILARRRGGDGGEYRPKTLDGALRLLDANLALVSVPGRYAAGVAREALSRGLHVFLFSNNVALDDEVALKRDAVARGLLCMGPDCGTAIIAGVPLGFANAVRRGPIGIIGASGTGTQEVSTLIHRWGGGVSHAIGTGGRDLSDEVGGLAMRQGVEALARDPATHVIVLVSKPPSPATAGALLGAADATGKPAVVCFLGARRAGGMRLSFAATLEQAARLAIEAAGLHAAEHGAAHEALPAQEAARLGPSQRYVRGLFSGGTNGYEALLVLRDLVGDCFSNVPLLPQFRLEHAMRSHRHAVVDLGADEFTVGRLHPMLDPGLRADRIVQEASDPETAVILFDVVLGYGAHPDPAGELAAAVERARAAAGDRRVVFVASVTGTDDDPQSRPAQVAALEAAGVIVAETNAAAARFAGLIARATGSAARASDLPAPPLRVARDAAPPPDVSGIERLFAGPLRAVNVGLETFADSLRGQGVEVLSLDWSPPAGGDQRMIELLRKLGS